MSGTTFPTPPPHASQPPQDNTWKIVLIVLGIIALVALLLCGGIAALGVYGFRQATSAVQEAVAEEFAGEILATPEAQQALGEITRKEVKLRDLAQPDQPHTIPVRVEGTRGSGTLQVRLRDGQVSDATLVMDDGRSIELSLPPEAATPPPQVEPTEDPPAEDKPAEDQPAEDQPANGAHRDDPAALEPPVQP